MPISGVCTPTTCAAQGKNCGAFADNCGGMLNCGTCTAPATCGGAGVLNACGSTTCVADNATACAGKCSGIVKNNCNQDIACTNSCPANETCGGGGTANVCGCTPDNASACAGKCNVTVTNNCGASVVCANSCSGFETCGGGGSAGVCGCTPNNPCLGKVCGSPVNSCGQTVSYGSCLAGATCNFDGTACSPVCSVATLGTITAITEINSGRTKVLGAVSPDDLTFVFTSNSTVNMSVADRTSSAAAFSTPVAIAAPTPPLANQRPIVTPDRLGIIYVAVGTGDELTKITRANTSTSTYGASNNAEFVNINSFLGVGGPTGFINSVAISGDGLSLMISVYDTGATSPNNLLTYEFTRASTAGVFANPVQQLGAARNPYTVTGMSADRRTVFFDNFSAANTWSHATRSGATGGLPTPTNVTEDFHRVMPNQDCSRLYGYTGLTNAFQAAQRTSD